MTDARVVFAGTPAFARASLAALVDAGVRPLAVYTQPDRPSGRGRKLTASPVKQYAQEQDLPVYQPPSLKDPQAQAELRAHAPDIVVVAAYGLIFPQAVLDIPAHGCLNVHASVLPRWRGAAPIQAAILAGDSETGISLMQMEAGLDSGPVFVRKAIPIGDDETAGELHDRLAALGGELLAEHLDDILAGRLSARPQDAALVTHAGKIQAADALLDWRQPAATLARAVRAYNPVPGARFAFDGDFVKCWRAEPCDGDGEPGRVLTAGAPGIVVACGAGALRLTELQRPGRKRGPASGMAELLSAGAQLPTGGD